MSSDAGTRSLHLEKTGKPIQELRKDSADKDAKINSFQHELERRKFHLSSALERENKFKSEKMTFVKNSLTQKQSWNQKAPR